MSNNFWKIEGLLTTASNLHIGDGRLIDLKSRCRCANPAVNETAEAERSESSTEGNLRPFVRDHQGRPYIPGSELKGVLVNWWKRHIDPSGNDAEVELFRNALLGEEIPVGTIEDPEIEYFGGKVTFCDATISDAEERKLPLPHYCPTCCTWVRTNTSIDRHTGAVLEGYLHQTELVPLGQPFRVTLLAKNLGGLLPGSKREVSAEEELKYLIALMEAFNGKAAPSLGAGTANGCGRLNWNLEAIASISAEDAFQKALQLGDEPERESQCHFAFCEPVDPQPHAEGLLQPSVQRLTVGLELTFHEGFLVRDPTQACQVSEPAYLLAPDNDATHPPKPGESVAIGVGDEHGRPIVPAESLRGVLRSRAEKILRTFVEPEDWDRVIGDLKQDLSDWDGGLEEEASSQSPSLIAQLFGASGWGSLLSLSDCKVTADAAGNPIGEPSAQNGMDRSRQLFHQDFVAINRITGGAANKRKFDCLAAYGLSFHGTLEVDLSRIDGDVPKWAIGLVALVMMDGCDGDLSLGYGKSKALGRFTLSLQSIDWPENTPNSWQPFKDVAMDELKSSSSLADTLRACVEALLERIGADNRPAEQPPQADPVTPVEAPRIDPNQRVTDDKFLNPYHFVPMVPEDIFGEDLPIETLDDAQLLANSQWRHVTHSRWVSASGTTSEPTQVFSGRIDLKVTPESPLVIGARQVELSDGRKRVVPFQLPKQKGNGWEPAIPATSMRGMISSLVEAATNSALRVLTNDALSRRSLAGRLTSTISPNRPFQSEALPALGMVKIRNGKKMILPLCLPPLFMQTNELVVEEPWRTIFPDESGEPLPMRVYLQAYVRGADDRLEVCTDGVFSGTEVPDSYHSGAPAYWYCKLSRQSPSPRGYRYADAAGFKTKGPRALGQWGIADDDPLLVPASSDEENARLKKDGYFRGILRVFGIEGSKDANLPRNHLNEYFIPLSKQAESNRQMFDAQEAADAFERACSDHDIYLLKGMLPPGEDKASRYSLGDGDIVFFDAAVNGTDIKVTKLAVSAIWREPVATLGTLVSRTSTRLLPFGYKDADVGENSAITLAEQMFGFVEERESSDEQEQTFEPAGKALAGRIQFRHGRPAAGANVRLRNAETLRILASPKLPCPSMYVKPHNGRALVKADVKEDGELQGRKFYLHGTAQGTPDNAAWRTQAPDDAVAQKAEVCAIDPEGAAFQLSIHFDNLSALELGALSYALRPTDAYRHKLGMGKPLGLGKTCVDLVGVTWCDRQARYRDAFSQGTFEIRGSQSGDASLLGQLKEQFRTRMHKGVRNAIELIGGSANDGISVQYPQVTGQTDLEKELYKWFVANDEESNRQSLTPINPSTTSLQPLRKHTEST